MCICFAVFLVISGVSATSRIVWAILVMGIATMFLGRDGFWPRNKGISEQRSVNSGPRIDSASVRPWSRAGMPQRDRLATAPPWRPTQVHAFSMRPG